MHRKILILATLIALVLLPVIINNNYILHLIIYTCMYGVLGMSFNIMWKNRLITAGTAGFWAVGGYTSALLVTKLSMPFWIAMPAGGVASALFALFIFSIALRGGPLVFFSVSLVSAFIVMEVLGTVSFFGGWEGLLDIPGPKVGPYLFFTKTSFYYMVLAILILNVVTFHALYTSRIGRAWTAIGQSTRLAEVQGVNIYRYRLAAAVIGCFWAGIIGSFYAHYQNLLIPTTFSFLCSIYVQMYALIGGLNYFIAGPIVGSLVMVFLPELLRAGQEYQPIFFGALLILIIVFLPGGLLSIGERFPKVGRLGERLGRKLRLVPAKS